jgi:hypothetical protein
MTRPYTASERNDSKLYNPSWTDSYDDYVFAASPSWPGQDKAVSQNISIGAQGRSPRLAAGAVLQAVLHHLLDCCVLLAAAVTACTGNAVWRVFLEPQDGWRPSWVRGVIASVVLGCLLMSTLVGIIMASWAQQARLLGDVMVRRPRPRAQLCQALSPSLLSAQLALLRDAHTSCGI